MKEYKSVYIKTEDINNLANRLNKCMVDGWYLKETIHKHIADPGYTHNFYFLLERKKQIPADVLMLMDRIDKQLNKELPIKL